MGRAWVRRASHRAGCGSRPVRADKLFKSLWLNSAQIGVFANLEDRFRYRRDSPQSSLAVGGPLVVRHAGKPHKGSFRRNPGQPAVLWSAVARVGRKPKGRGGDWTEERQASLRAPERRGKESQ